MNEKQVNDDLFVIILNVMINHNGKNSLLINIQKKNRFFYFIDILN